MIQKIDFDSLKSNYLTNFVDTESYNTKIKYRNFYKEVYYDENQAPKEYTDLILFLLNLRNKNLDWADGRIKVTTRDKIPYVKLLAPPVPPPPVE